jgi:hypothetical protein
MVAEVDRLLPKTMSEESPQAQDISGKAALDVPTC